MVSIARQLAGRADSIVVVDPPDLRRELAEIGSKLVRAHADRPLADSY
jgi:hypothetical protein